MARSASFGVVGWLPPSRRPGGALWATLGPTAGGIRGILDGSVDASRVFYVNVDDNLNGLYEKLQLAEEFGFAVLAEGHNGFKIDNLVPTLVRMPDLRIHDLRHSAASFMAAAGIDLYTIGKVLGHANYKTTSRYAHLQPEQLIAAVEAGAAKLGVEWIPKPVKEGEAADT